MRSLFTASRTALAPALGGSGDLSVSLALQVDFKETPPPSDNTYSLTTGQADEDVWENVDPNWEDWDITWLETDTIVRRWLSAEGSGFAMGVRMRITGQQSSNWFSISYMITLGGLV